MAPTQSKEMLPLQKPSTEQEPDISGKQQPEATISEPTTNHVLIKGARKPSDYLRVTAIYNRVLKNAGYHLVGYSVDMTVTQLQKGKVDIITEYEIEAPRPAKRTRKKTAIIKGIRKRRGTSKQSTLRAVTTASE